MKKSNLFTGVMASAMLLFATTACKDQKKSGDAAGQTHSEHMEQQKQEGDAMGSASGGMASAESGTITSRIIDNYLALKNALVSDNQDQAAEAGKSLEGNLGNLDAAKFNETEQGELEDILKDATEHAEHISRSPIDHQREHFDMLSKDIADLIAITGTDRTLYQDFCPMYNNNKGASWLSAEQEIRNPYFGNKMLSCGVMQKEYN